MRSNLEITKIDREFFLLQEGQVKLINDYNIILHLINLTECQILINQLKDQYQILPDKDDQQKQKLDTLEIKLQTLIPHHIIHKRGLINIIGKGMKFVYGTMDDDDRENIEQSLKALEENNEELLKNNNKQVKINQQFNEQFLQLKDIFKRSSNTLNKYKKIKSEINSLRMEIEFNKNLLEVQEIIGKISDIIMTSRTGVLTQDILTIQEIFEYEINFDKLKELKITLATYNENLLIILSIPTFNDKLFNKIYIQTFPVKNKIIKLHSNEFIETNKTLYYVTKEIKNLQEIKDNCIRNLFKNNINLDCKIEEFKEENIIINKEKYLIIKNLQKEKIKQNCNNLDYTLEGNYILELEDCKIEIRNKTYNKKLYQNNFKIIPLINYNFTEDYYKELNFKPIDNIEMLESKIHKHITYNLVTFVVVVIIVIFVIIYLRIKLKNKKSITNISLPTVTFKPLESSKEGGVITMENNKGIF